MDQERTRFIWSLIFSIIIATEGIIVWLVLRPQTLWTLEDRIVIAVVAVPFLAGSLLGGCIGNRLRVEINVIISFVGGNLVLFLINSLLPHLPAENSNLNRLIIMAILWSSAGTIAGYRAVRFIYGSGFREYFFTVGVTFAATCLTAILVEGPVINLLECLKNNSTPILQKSVMGCKILDMGDQWDIYSIYLTAGIFWITLTGGEVTRFGFRTVLKRFFQVITLLGAFEFLVEFLASDFISNLIWLVPQIQPSDAYGAFFALAVAGLLAFPLNAESLQLAGLSKTNESVGAPKNLNGKGILRNQIWTILEKYFSASPGDMEKNGILTFSVISYLLITTCSFLYVHMRVGFRTLFSFTYESFQSSTGTGYITALVVLLYGIGGMINLFFVSGLATNKPGLINHQNTLSAIQRTMWNAHKNFVAGFIGSDYAVKADGIANILLVQGVSLIRSLVRITAISFAPLLKINVVTGVALFSTLIWFAFGRSVSSLAAWGTSIFFYWFIGGYLSMISLIAQKFNVREKPNRYKF